MDRGESCGQIAVVFSADIVGYSIHIDRDEIGTVTLWSTMFKQFVCPLIERHSGEIFKETGDGFLARFPAAGMAVTCANTFQHELDKYYQQNSTTYPFQFRIGIDAGDLIKEGTDYHGRGVIEATRCQSNCEPGGVCISSAIFKIVSSEHGAQFISATATFKNQMTLTTIYKSISNPKNQQKHVVTDDQFRKWVADYKRKRILLTVFGFFHNNSPKYWFDDRGFVGVALTSLYFISSMLLISSWFWFPYLVSGVKIPLLPASIAAFLTAACFAIIKYHERHSGIPFRDANLLSDSAFSREEMLRRAATRSNFESNADDPQFWKTLAHSVRNEVQARLPETKVGTINAAVMVFCDADCSRIRIFSQTDRNRVWDGTEEYPCRDLFGYHAARRGSSKVLEDISNKWHPFRRESLEAWRHPRDAKMPRYRCIFTTPIFATKSNDAVDPTKIVGFIAVDSDRPYHFALNRGDRLAFALYPFSTFASLVLKCHPHSCPVMGDVHVKTV